jgi:mutator protein MutT
MEPAPFYEKLSEWKRASYAFCPKCGGRLTLRRVCAHDPERMVCSACGFVFFEDPKVAVGTIIPIDGKILLTRRAIEPGYGKWVFPSGFVDRGEHTEDAAIREAKEECHVEVRITRLLNIYSYPDHPVIVIVYVAEAIGGHPATSDETLEAELFYPDQIPWDDLAFDSTGRALQEYLATLDRREARDIA